MTSKAVQGDDELATLRSEYARLIALLDAHGIEWRLPPEPIPLPPPDVEPSNFSTTVKVALFRRLFRGRTDVYPLRWESKTTGKVGYTPACANEWKAGVCDKRRIKCSDCNHRLLRPLSDTVITMVEVANATGIHRTTLSKLSNHRGYNPTADVLDRLCNYFNCRIEQLVEHIPDTALK